MFHAPQFQNAYLTVHQITQTLYETISYLLVCNTTHQAIIIDPSEKAYHKIVSIEKNYSTLYKIQISCIINTHGHIIFGNANKLLKHFFNIPIMLHHADATFYADPKNQVIAAKELNACSPSVSADITLSDQSIINCGNINLQVIHTPGHTPGSVCFFTPGHLFTGDTLLPGDIGNVALLGGDLKTLIHSLQDKIMPIPGDTFIWPARNTGSGRRSKLAYEIDHNQYIREFIKNY